MLGNPALAGLLAIHHGGDAKTWGEAIREAFGDATRRLALTGTPFRSDDSPIPFITYEPDSAGALRSKADHSYGYADALACYKSPEYQANMKHRTPNAVADIIIIEGYDGPQP